MKIMKYESPEIEVTRFNVYTKIMGDNVFIPGGGDGDSTKVPGDEYISADDYSGEYDDDF